MWSLFNILHVTGLIQIHLISFSKLCFSVFIHLYPLVCSNYSETCNCDSLAYEFKRGTFEFQNMLLFCFKITLKLTKEVKNRFISNLFLFSIIVRCNIGARPHLQDAATSRILVGTHCWMKKEWCSDMLVYLEIKKLPPLLWKHESTAQWEGEITGPQRKEPKVWERRIKKSLQTVLITTLVLWLVTLKMSRRPAQRFWHKTLFHLHFMAFELGADLKYVLKCWCFYEAEC